MWGLPTASERAQFVYRQDVAVEFERIKAATAPSVAKATPATAPPQPQNEAAVETLSPAMDDHAALAAFPTQHQAHDKRQPRSASDLQGPVLRHRRASVDGMQRIPSLRRRRRSSVEEVEAPVELQVEEPAPAAAIEGDNEESASTRSVPAAAIEGDNEESASSTRDLEARVAYQPPARNTRRRVPPLRRAQSAIVSRRRGVRLPPLAAPPVSPVLLPANGVFRSRPLSAGTRRPRGAASRLSARSSTPDSSELVSWAFGMGGAPTSLRPISAGRVRSNRCVCVRRSAVLCQ